MGDLHHLAVVVTGASSGIGRATAAAFAMRGAATLLVGRDAERLDDAAGSIPDAVALRADLTAPHAADLVVAAALDAFGRIDVLVNNAGAFATAPLAGTDEHLLATLLQTNVTAPAALARAALPTLAASRGSIVNVSSTFGHRAAPGASAYAASKAALESLTRSWSVELADKGIRVNAVAPGPTATPILQRAGLTPEQAADHERDMIRRVPLARLGAPEEVAEVIVDIAISPYVTGQVLAVDGGLSVA